MNADQKIVQHLSEAHALESALVQTLGAHIAMTPRSEYRDLLERHLEETRAQAERLQRRMSQLGESRNPLELAYAAAQTAVGQLIAAGKFPLDLLRGTGGEEKLVKNAKDEAASEALEIATYDALEALAQAAGDEKTATLAREHRAQEERFLADLRAVIPQLVRDAYAADVEGEPSFDAATTGAVDAARAAASEVRERARSTDGKAQEAQEEPAEEQSSGGDAGGDLPIEGYADLSAAQVLPKLRLLTADDLKRIEAFERSNRNRKQVLARVEKLRSSTNGSRPARVR